MEVDNTMPLWAWLVCFAAFGFTGFILWLVGRFTKKDING